MPVWKKVLDRARDIFGFKHNSKYVKNYLNSANMRSGVFMSAVIFVLEIWLVIRQFDKYIIPQLQAGQPFFKSVFTNTSNFWLLMSFGLAMMFYCIYYMDEKKRKWVFWAAIGASIASLVFVALMPFEFIYSSIKFTNIRNDISAGLKIALYAVVFLFDLSVIGATIYIQRGGKIQAIKSVVVISLFALVCLIFGIMVSFGDFSSSAKFDSGEYQHKQIICFLMMSIYVGCLLIWKPYISVGILGTIFLGFYLLLKGLSTWMPGSREFPEGDEVNYITFFISLTMICISIYDQRVSEGRKDEELELLATKDKLSGLYAFEYFINLCGKKIEDEGIKKGEYIYLFLDITSFKIFNDQRGFNAGNVFLRNVGEIITKEFPDALVSRQSDDHFAVFTKYENIEERLQAVDDQVKDLDLDIRPGVKVGGYPFYDKSEDIHQSIGKARYACAVLKKQGGHKYLLHDRSMHEKYMLIQYIVSHIDEAVNNGWIVTYYQPVGYSKDRKLCGVEALARWIDPKYGFLNPGVFVGALEDAQLAYKLDLCMLEQVCQNMRRVLDEGGVIVPTSINFSRADFSIVDIPSEVKRITKKYKIEPKYLHIEITESALLEEQADLKAAMKRLKENGFAIWLDDFGSGYSSFNALKDYSFDVLKLDMEFLKGFESNDKSKPLIKSVIDMAGQIGMRTLAEGVETDSQATFLKSIGCEKMQGYLFSKPIPYEELNKAIKEGKFVISDNLE